MGTRIRLLTILLFLCTATVAQEFKTITWMEDSTSYALILKDTAHAPILMELIVDAIKREQLQAYRVNDIAFTEPMLFSELKKLFESRVDTEYVMDPIDGSEKTKVITTDFLPASIRKLRILGYPRYDPQRDKTTVDPIGIIPMHSLYADNGTFMAYQQLFLIRYDDLKAITKKYDEYHPYSTFAQRLTAAQ